MHNLISPFFIIIMTTFLVCELSQSKKVLFENDPLGYGQNNLLTKDCPDCSPIKLTLTTVTIIQTPIEDSETNQVITNVKSQSPSQQRSTIIFGHVAEVMGFAFLVIFTLATVGIGSVIYWSGRRRRRQCSRPIDCVVI